MKQLILVLMCVLILSGCAALGKLTGPTPVAELPTTATQQLMQTVAGTNWLLTLAIIGVGAGFFAFLNGSSKGLQFMAACFVTLSLIIGLTRYSAWIAASAMIGAVALMVYSVLVKNKALKEVVEGVQRVREIGLLPGSGDTEAIIKRNVDSFLHAAESKTTEGIVKAVKGTL